MARDNPFGDMARSLGLLLVIVAVVLLVGPARALLFPTSKDERPPVDFAHIEAGFAEDAGRAPVLPVGLPSDWKVNGASVEHTATLGDHLHVGWVTPDTRYVGLDEATGSANALVRSIAGKRALSVTGSTKAPGRRWQVRTSERGEPVYTTTYAGLTVLVTGNATPDEFDLVLRLMRPAPVTASPSGSPSPTG